MFPKLCAPVVALLLLVPQARTAAIADTTPPQVVAFEISRLTEPTRLGNYIIKARFTDDLSGVVSPEPSYPLLIVAHFRSPHGGLAAPVVSVNLYPEGRLPVPFNPLNHPCTGLFTIPPLSHAGIWSLIQLDVSDNAQNVGHYTASDLQNLGLPTSFTVSGPEDTTPPELVSLSLEPSSIDTSASAQTITLLAHLKDDLSGLAVGFTPNGKPLPPPQTLFRFLSPSKSQAALARFDYYETSEDNREGFLRAKLDLPPYSEPGTWRLNSAVISDAVQNLTAIDLPTAIAKGFPTEFNVTGAGDITPPKLRALDFHPRRIDTSETNQPVTVELRITDDLSGFFSSSGTFGYFSSVSATFLSPSKGQSATIQSALPLFETANAQDLVVTNTLYFPRYSETGVWTLTRFETKDIVGNATVLLLQDLRQLAFPTALAIGISPALRAARQNDVILLSWPTWASNFQLQSHSLDNSATWQPVNIAPATIDEQLIVALPTSEPLRFYRLTEQP